ncbi:APC family permease [Haloarcula japonica]|uniref:Amino acid permease n=1 Tax=Haloarcula japonica (strain ATCC 49778 / DSM 6131 / JCM 7785 / NBRC 101032 / NCIMB 13157 / TR-1) TaxID=1227453 RepID=M0LNS6_HALJT|nr:APC family permease [Haloarcula japonica]EMA33685.1 amino acid permease [Haloarcula japonica DSM 6131]
MGESDLGLAAAVSIALGGMIGGGIYAVLGVVAQITMAATWAAFVLAGVVALCAGYSYNALNSLRDAHGGSVSFVQCHLGNTTLAGMVGWTLLFGYIGSMAMYAFAFAEFAIALGLPDGVVGLPMRPVVSVLAVAAFVGLNLLGAGSTGAVENVLVALKLSILVAFGILGLVYAYGFSATPVDLGLDRLTSADPIVAAAISFVAFQGWQLLFYDQESIEDPAETIRKAVYISIPVAVAVYVLVGIVTVTLVPDALTSTPHVALKDAAATMLSPYGLASLGAALLSMSALFSTGSAINATLFSAAHFAKGMLTDDLLPDHIGDAEADGVPERTVVLIGAVTAAFAAVGSLNAITSFASLSFIIIFGAMSALALRQRDSDAVHPVPPAVGAVGALGFFPLMLQNLWTREPGTFYMVVVIACAVIAVEVLYFEREYLEREVARIEATVPESVDSD